jgi:DNA-binding transcriptional LysR family regulator
MSNPDLNLLLDLDALLKTGSVAGAAKQLHISAPAMSRRLARLRETMADPLFVPAGRGLVPTQRALSLREPLYAVIEDARRVFAPTEVDFSRLERTLILRANDGLVGPWASRLIARMYKEAPGVSLRFIHRNDKGVHALRDGLVDLDIGVLSESGPEIYSQQLFRTEFVGVVRAKHPLAAGRVTVAAYTAWPHVSASRRGYLHGPIDAALKGRGVQRRVVVVAPGFQSALAMIVESDLIASIPEPFARWAAQHQRLHIFKLPVKTPVVEVSQSWHPRYQGDPVHRWLRGHVFALCKDAAGPPRRVRESIPR